MNRKLMWSWLVAGAMILAACGGGDAGTTEPGDNSPPAVATVTVSVPTAQLVQGATVSAVAEVRSSSGAQLSGRSLSWNSSVPAVATVDAAGVVRGVAPGNTTISVTSEGRTGSVVLTVIPPPVATINVTVASTIIATGTTTIATAELRDAAGGALTGRVVNWVSSAPSVATVDASGAIVGVSPGTTNISATSEGKSALVSMTVIPPPVATVDVQLAQATVNVGAVTTATAVIRDNAGNVLSSRIVNWSSSAPTVAIVSANGTITSVAVGTTVITATSEGKTGSASLKVQLPPVASISITGASGSMLAGDRRQLTATARDANNAILADRLIVWSSNNQSVATVSATGEVTAVSPGTATISATSEGRSGTSVVSVLSSVASVTLTGSSRIKVGDTYNYTATARRADGTVIVRPIVWSVKQPSTGVVTSSGALTPLQAGTLTLQVEIDGEIWHVDYAAYDWDTFASGGNSFATLEADNTIVNKFGRSEYARIVFACSVQGYFFSWVSTQNFVTQNGNVALSFDGGTPFSQTWNESDDFNTLFRPGNNLSIKSFAAQVASARLFGFAFTEFQASAKAMIFRVTGFSARLQPLLAQCPSNSLLVAGDAADSDSFASARLDVMARFSAAQTAASGKIDPSVSALRAIRAEAGSMPAVTPVLLRNTGVDATSIKAAVRRK